MTKLRIHTFQNEKWGRYHLPWFRMFIDYLSDIFEVESVNYNVNGSTFRGKINLQTEIKNFGNNPPLSDVDCVIENIDNGEFCIITFGKNITSYVVHYLRSDKCLGVLAAHFSQRFLYNSFKKNRILNKLDKVHPFIFGFFQEFDVDYYRDIRNNTKDLNEGLYFKGGGWKGGEKSYRKVIRHLYDKNILDPSNVRIDNYLLQLSQQKIAVSHYMDLDYFKHYNDHPGELCYRDIEMMSIGVPFIRIEYKSEIHDGLKPNYHYIVIPRETAYLTFEEKGHEGVADLFIEKYNEVKNDVDFLNFISNNQRKWYDENMRWPKSAELAINKLNIKKWI